MSKNVVILIGLLAMWLLVVRLKSSTNLNTSNSENDESENNADTQSLTTVTDNNYVQVSKTNAINTKSMHTDNTDLEPFGRSYTS